MNSPPVTIQTTTNKLQTPGVISTSATTTTTTTSSNTSSSADVSPFIKRKCLARLSNNNTGDSPFLIASGNLNKELSQDSEKFSGKDLNDR